MTRRSATRAVVFALAATFLAGCSLTAPTLNAGTLRRESATITSDTAEGALVAKMVLDDKTLSTTTRVRCKELGDDLDKSGAKLTVAKSSPKLEKRATAASSISGDGSDALAELYRHPTDKDVARRVKAQLEDLSSQASDIEDAATKLEDDGT